MRKLATIRKIDKIEPIEGADAIECATVGGWKVVVKKGDFKEGSLAVYFEIDSWIPTEIAPFLTKGKEPREFEGVKGERLRTIKLRGQLSQGLLLPISPTCDNIESELFEGLDVSFPLNIKKWEMTIPAQLAGEVKGSFPALIPKTDQERCQNLVKEIKQAAELGLLFEVTEKLEGSSMTVYRINGEFGVCSRNIDLKKDEKNSFWATAIKNNIESKMINYDPTWDFAIQGELVGPGIQGNIYGLKELDFYVFDIYDIKHQKYLIPLARRYLIEKLELKHVPYLIAEKDLGVGSVDEILSWAQDESKLAPNVEREGIVFKSINGSMSFKAISNKYLLGQS